MAQFLARTGIADNAGDPARRYLWTDAFAVQACFGLARALNEPIWRDHAVRLIDEVHRVLGRHRADDSRSGWISGYPEEYGAEHPTAGGLRIGKPLPERRPDEPADERLEWDQDGQYFHYLTRWMQALLTAHRETGDDRYATWAAELALASRAFVTDHGMAWKMSIDLSRPLVDRMGHHDPLDGLVCVVGIERAAPDRAEALAPLRERLERLCYRHNWTTLDPLGIGGLMLNVLRVARLGRAAHDLPATVTVDAMLDDTLVGLSHFARQFDPRESARFRLAFREGGLSLGMHALTGCVREQQMKIPGMRGLDEYRELPDAIDRFWTDPDNQGSPTWIDHLDINAVTLAASLLARDAPCAFG